MTWTSQNLVNHSQLCNWLPKIHETPVGARFIVASYYCSNNPLSETISKNFKMIFNAVENLHRKGFFYLGCRKFWVVQNSFSIATMLNKINVKKKSVSTFQCSTFYTTTLDKLLIKVLSDVISFVFKSKVRQHIDFFKTSIYWTSKGVGRRYFAKKTLVNAISFFINKCFFTLLVTCFLNKILVYQLILTQHHFGPAFSFIFLNLSI